MIEIKNLNKQFNEKVIFQDFNLTIEKNKITGILGPSGIGKTTLINIISGLWKSDSGVIEGVSQKDISYIFQEPRLLPWKNVYDNLDYVLKRVYKEDAVRKKIILKNLSMVGLENEIYKFPDELSGGMMQRVSIARAFAYPMDLLIMDEPFKGLDIQMKNNVMNAFIKIWNESKKTVIFVTHDIDEVILLADNIYIIDGNPVQIQYNQNINIEKENRNIENNCKKIKDEILDFMK